MRRAACLIGTVCGWLISTRAYASPPAAECKIHDTRGKVAGEAKLSVRGQQFAIIGGQFDLLDVTITKKRARAHLETKAFELDGDLALDAIRVAPRDNELRDSWIRIFEAKARVASKSSLQIEVPLPKDLKPASVSFSISCQELTFADVPRDFPKDAERVGFVRGATRLLKSPEGGVLATIIGRRAEKSGLPVDGYVLERRGKMVRVRIGGANVVEGWVAATALGTPMSFDDMPIYGGRLVTKPDPATMFRCGQPVPIFVRADGAPIQVGRVKSDADFRVTGDQSKDEVVIDLGDTKATPFVRRADLATCSDRGHGPPIWTTAP